MSSGTLGIDSTYVGVTGYTSLDQALAVHKATAHLLDKRVLMDGYLMWAHDVAPRWTSNRPVSANFSSRLVPMEEAHRVFSSPSHGTLRLIHFRTQVDSHLDEQLGACVERFGLGIDGFQINWIEHPHPTELSDFKREQDLIRGSLGKQPIVVVLQLHPGVLIHAGDDLNNLVRYVSPYAESGSITHVLYDPSGGLGRGFRPDHAMAAVARLRLAFPSLSLGVAGGLSAANVREIVELLWRADSRVNIDVEGRVRDPLTDALLLDEVVAYVSAALEVGTAVDTASERSSSIEGGAGSIPRENPLDR